MRSIFSCAGVSARRSRKVWRTSNALVPGSMRAVARTRRLAQHDLEAAVRCNLELLRVEKARLQHLAVGLVAALLRAEAQVGHRAAPPRHAIFAAAVETRVLVQVVGIVGADLRGLVRRREKAGPCTVRELDVHLERDAHQPAQVAESFRARQRIVRRLGAQDLFSAAFQGVAEVGWVWPESNCVARVSSVMCRLRRWSSAHLKRRRRTPLRPGGLRKDPRHRHPAA